MMFVLSADRSGTLDEVRTNAERYREYLDQHRQTFPPGAFALATANWYFELGDHRSPHDARLEQFVISESVSGTPGEARIVGARTRLLGAYHDGYIEFHYPRVYRYQIGLDDGGRGHVDWRYDEFRLTTEGHLLHEIEWWAAHSTGRWLIEANDVEYRWLPNAATAGS